MSTAEQPSPATTRRGPRVRPVTWAILAWMLVMIACIVGAWQGSESRMGAVPEVAVATDSGSVTVPPYNAVDLDGTTYSNPVPRFAARDDQTLSVRLPVELQRTTVRVFEVRTGGEEQLEPPRGESPVLVPVTTDKGRLTGLVVRGVPGVYSADGSESILNGEWSVEIVEAPADGTHAAGGHDADRG